MLISFIKNILQKEKMKINYNSKIIEIPKVRVLNGIENFTSGLMFSRKEKSRAILFNFKKTQSFNFTSLFVFFPFIILWMNDKNEVIDKKIVKPFRWCIPSVKTYNKVLEIPINKFYEDKIVSLVGT